MNKNDPRYINAERKIIEAVFYLLPNRDIDSISTKEIIESARIHKSTFYSHFRDKYSLMESLIDLAVKDLTPHLKGITQNMLGSDPDPDRLYKCYRSLADSIFDNRDLLKVILSSSMSGRIISRIEKELEAIWQESGIADPQDRNIEYLINAASYVMVGTIEKWLQRNCIDSVETFTWLIHATGEGIRNTYELL